MGVGLQVNDRDSTPPGRTEYARCSGANGAIEHRGLSPAESIRFRAAKRHPAEVIGALSALDRYNARAGPQKRCCEG